MVQYGFTEFELDCIFTPVVKKHLKNNLIWDGERPRAAANGRINKSNDDASVNEDCNQSLAYVRVCVCACGKRQKSRS